MSAGPVRAGDDDDDDDGMTFEEKIIDNLMSGIGAKSMEKKRHRIPRALAAGGAAQARPAAARQRRGQDAPNWPKDPDEKRRKEAIAARKKATKATEYWQAARRCRPPR